jgi:hypothetical protein
MVASNPERASRGGAVPGTTKSYSSHGRGVDVALSSFDPGYNLLSDYEGGEGASESITQADLIRGYVASGRLVGGGGKK